MSVPTTKGKACMSKALSKLKTTGHTFWEEMLWVPNTRKQTTSAPPQVPMPCRGPCLYWCGGDRYTMCWVIA